LQRLVERTGTRIGDPTDKDVYMGPVIDARAVARFDKAAAAAREAGTVHIGGERLTGAAFDHGHFVAPTVVSVPRDHWIVKSELFLPFVLVEPFDTLEEAVGLANDVDYGLTAGVLRRPRGYRLSWTTRRPAFTPTARLADHRRVARRAVVLRLEGIRLHRQGRLRPVVRVPVHARAVADPDGVM
jgi:1-pyrroline-5-carboxylate dehydrogenase